MATKNNNKCSRIVLLNADKLNFDHRLSFANLRASTFDLNVYYDSDHEKHITEESEVVITKEMEMSAKTIASLPASVKLIVEVCSQK